MAGLDQSQSDNLSSQIGFGLRGLPQAAAHLEGTQYTCGPWGIPVGGDNPSFPTPVADG